MKRTFLLIATFFCTIGLAFHAYGDEMAAEPEPVESAILLFEPDLFAVPSSVALPAWIARVGFEGGDVGGGSSAWRVAESAPMGTGKLWVELDRSVLDENLALSVVGERKVPSDMVIQLWDGQGRIVALDLFGNITAVALESRTDTFVVPLWKYPSATRIVLRRVSGATTIYGLALIPVVMEQDIGANTVEALQFARMLGDPLSPENELVRRVRVITSTRAAAGSAGQDELVVAPTRVDAPVAPDWRKGLLAFYSFSDDEGARVSDQSGKKRDGKVENAEWTVDGRIGGAMRFGPTNSYVVASDEGLPMGDAVRSIAFWMKLGASRNLSNPLVYGTLRYNQNFSLGMDWRLGRNSICVGQHGAVNVASRKFETGRWYHIVYTYGGGSEHRFYIDGVEDPLAVREIRAPLETVSSGSLYLGLRAGLDSAAHSFDGWLDEVMIFDRVLDPAEVRQLYEPGGLGINSMDQKRGVFFVAGNDLYRMNMDGTDCVVVATGASGARSLVADPAKKMVYMTTWDNSDILGYDIAEGGAARQFYNGIGSGGQGLGYDPELSKFFVGLYYRGIYALDAQQPSTWQHIVKSSQLSPMHGQRGQLQLDVKNQHVYFRTAFNGDSPLRYIWRVNYDGTGLVKVIGANGGDALALDLSAGHLYFTDLEAQSMRFVEIRRANLDGTDSQTILKLPHLPYNYCTKLALDLQNKKMYMSLTAGVLPDGTAKWDDRAIGRANLDGSNFEILWQMPGAGGGNGLTLYSR